MTKRGFEECHCIYYLFIISILSNFVTKLGTQKQLNRFLSTFSTSEKSIFHTPNGKFTDQLVKYNMNISELFISQTISQDLSGREIQLFCIVATLP